MLKQIKKYYFLLILFGIVLLGGFLRFYELTAIPNGFNRDEAAIGYNAYSILKTGKDEYGKKMPLYFKSFGDQKLPAYIYMTSISESVFGINEFAVRFPSAFLGSLTIILLYFVVYELTKDRRVALIGSFLLAVNPWHLLFSRAAFEDNGALFFATCGVWLFLVAFRKKQWVWLFVSLLGFALSLYSYNVTRLLSPVILASLVFFNWKDVNKMPRWVIGSSSMFFLALLLPFLLTFFSQSGAASAHGALITSNDIQAKDIEMRSYLAGHWRIIGSIFFNKYLFLIWQYCQNLVGSLTTTFFFITGSVHGNQGIGTQGMFYLPEFLSILWGIVVIISKRKKEYLFFLVWAIAAWLTLSLSKEVPHATRGYFLVLPFEVFSAFGIVEMWKYLQKKKKIISVPVLTGFFLLCGYSLVYFFCSFFIRFPIAYAKEWSQQDSAVALYIKKNEYKYDKIIIDDSAGFMYTSLLFFNRFDPVTFQNSVKRLPDDTEGFSTVTSFGKYVWENTSVLKGDIPSRTLLITTDKRIPISGHVIQTFTYPEKPIVFSSKEVLYQYPVTETAFVAVEKN